MNIMLILRYALELSMVLPAAFLSILPVREYKRLTTKFIIYLFVILIGVFIPCGSVICAIFNFTSNTVLFPFMMIAFAVYHFCFEMPFAKKLYSYLTAAMLCGFSTMYSVFVTAPIEIHNTNNVFFVSSNIICLGLTGIMVAAFFKTFAYKLPELFENHSIEKMWVWLISVPLVMTAICVWMTPLSPKTAMVGRIRKVCLIVLLLIPVVSWFLTHIQWQIAKNMTKTAELQQSYDILKLEEKQYIKTLRAFEETRMLRHDFRQHLLVINDLAQKGDTQKLIEYISPFLETSGITQTRLFENYTLNAVACHYTELAKENDTKILWNINVPENIPFKESDICALFGNLIENSLTAVSKLPSKEREIHIALALKQESLLIISITNPYEGEIIFDKNGFPKATKDNHGIGIKSIINTVERYKGSMSIETKNGCFDVGILLNAPEAE